MTELKCTPGHLGPKSQELVSSSGKSAAVFVDCGSQEENAANAPLMAAAPDLYEAAKVARDTIAAKVCRGGLSELEMEVVKLCDEAMAKARGEK